MRGLPRTLAASVAAILILSALVAFTTGVSSDSVESSRADRIIWTGRSGGFVLRWGTSEISASSATTPTDIRFSAKALIKRDVEAFKEPDPMTGKPDDCTYERTLTVLSVVGSLVSLRDNYYVTCTMEAHPGGETRYTALDLAKPGEAAYKQDEMNFDIANPGKAVRLTDLFSEADIFNAMLADPFVKKQVENFRRDHPEKPPPPKTLDELTHSLWPDLDKGECYSVADDMFTRFAFHHIENGKVAVRLGLSGAGPCREKLTELGILLPIPQSLKSALALADSGKEGFLMKDLKKVSRGQTTKLVFKTGKGAQH